MFCDRCGTQLSGTQTFCSSCGKAISPGPPRPAAGRIAGHLHMLGIFWMAYSVFRLISGWFFSTFFARFPVFWFTHVPFSLPGIFRGAGMFLMAGGVLGIVAGWGLIDRQPWARILAIVLGFFALFHFGIGTALGIYTLWVLLPAESGQEYQRMARVI